MAQPTDPLTGGLCSVYSVIRNSNSDSRYVPYINFVPHGSSVLAGKVRGSYGRHLLDHLAADGAGLAAGEVAVIALLQVDADLTWCVFTSKNREFLM